MTAATSETKYAFSNSHNVYILGAGFSKDSGMPLMGEFLNEMRDALMVTGPGRDADRDALERVFAFRHSAAGATYRTFLDIENIEELFSLASASPEGRRAGVDLSGSVARAIGATLDYCSKKKASRQCALFVNANANPPFPTPSSWKMLSGTATNPGYHVPVSQLYAGIISGRFVEGGSELRNTVITFNYDLVLDDAMRAIGANYTYGPSVSGPTVGAATGTSTTILKLHGSMNWAASKDTPDTVDVRATYDDVRKDGASPVLMPPTWRKDFGGVFAGVWDAAVDALVDATNIVVIGFSMPPNDTHFKYLLSAGLQHNISLRRVVFVDPALKRERIEGVFRPEVKVELSENNTASAFFSSRPACARIGRLWLEPLTNMHLL